MYLSYLYLFNFVSALKMTNGSYVINGEFAISTPGTYDAVGARFIYSRVRGLDSIFTLGPIHHPIDIMVGHNNFLHISKIVQS